MNAPSIKLQPAPYSARGLYHLRVCPHCNSRDSVYRVKRRLIDRALSLFVPVQRYSCDALGCGWEGNLPAQRD